MVPPVSNPGAPFFKYASIRGSIEYARNAESRRYSWDVAAVRLSITMHPQDWSTRWTFLSKRRLVG